ncbi:MAG: hypothetical protein GSR73_03525 [Desulfurococcales archaeon]|nr:hypothetical protein [Desulfurococcales archaeon]
MATKKVTIEVEVPEELAKVIEKTPWLKKIIAREGIEGLKRRMELQAQLDLLTPEIHITEEEIMEIDRKIKRALARRLQNELPQDNS